MAACSRAFDQKWSSHAYGVRRPSTGKTGRDYAKRKNIVIFSIH